MSKQYSVRGLFNDRGEVCRQDGSIVIGGLPGNEAVEMCERLNIYYDMVDTSRTKQELVDFRDMIIRLSAKGNRLDQLLDIAIEKANLNLGLLDDTIQHLQQQ